jgi:hypothetical protein
LIDDQSIRIGAVRLPTKAPLTLAVTLIALIVTDPAPAPTVNCSAYLVCLYSKSQSLDLSTSFVCNDRRIATTGQLHLLHNYSPFKYKPKVNKRWNLDQSNQRNMVA